MKINELLESRMAASVAAQAKLTEAWAPIINASEAYAKKSGKDLSAHHKHMIAQCCENALMAAGSAKKSRLFETTDSSNIDFLGIQLPIIAALIPSTVLDKIAITQALDRRSGAIFYLDAQYAQAKGSISAASTMMSAKTGHNSTIGGRRYASVRVYHETVSGGGSQAKTGTLAYLPYVVGSLTITDGTETFTDDGLGALVSDASGGVNGTISAGGVWSVVFATTPGASIYLDYKYNYETKTTSAIPEVNFDLVAETVTAEDFPLMARYTLAAALDLEKAHGINLEDEVVKYLGGEVRFTMDHLGIDLINDASVATGCATSPGTFSATPSTGEPWIWKKYSFVDFVEKANQNIIAKTLRMQCTFLIVGNDGARIIRQLQPNFKPAAGLEGITPTGPYELGSLDGRVVIHDPLITTSQVIFGWKGDSLIQGAFLFAPYIPLMTTPTLITATDLKAQKGFLSSAAYKVINNGAFCRGTISGLA